MRLLIDLAEPPSPEMTTTKPHAQPPHPDMTKPKRRKRSTASHSIYPFAFLFTISFLVYIGHTELHRHDNSTNLEPLDPVPFDLHQLPSDTLIPSFSATPNTRFPLHLLKTGHHSQIHDLIITNQVALDDIDPDNGYTLLHYLTRSYNLQAMKFVIDQNVHGPNSVNIKSNYNSYCNTPLHLAVTHPNFILSLFFTNLLINSNADASIPNALGLTARDLASQSHMDERILKIIDKEYDPRIDFESNTKTYLDFAFGPRGPPKDPYFFN